MAQWNETFKSYPVHSSLVNFEAVVGGIDWWQFTPNTPDQLSRIPHIATYIRNKLEKVEQIIKSLGEKVAEQETRIVTLVGRSDETQKVFHEIKTQIDTQKSRLDVAITEFQKQFSEAEDRRRSDFDTQLKKQSEDYKLDKEKFEKENKQFIDLKNKESMELLEGFQKQGSTAIQFLEERKKLTSDLLKVISNIGVTGNFNKIANSDRKWADWLRIIAFVFMAGAAGLAIYTVFYVIKGDFDWKNVLFRITTTLILFVPGYYAAKESEKHRRSEQRYRRMELELASIDPYLESLPEDKRHTLKETLAQRFFGQPEKTEVIMDGEDIVTAKSLFDLFKEVIKHLVKK